MQNAHEKNAAGEGINEFVQKHRKSLFVSAGVVLALLIASIAAFSLMDMLQGKAIEAVEELGSRYETLRPSIAGSSEESDAAQDALVPDSGGEIADEAVLAESGAADAAVTQAAASDDVAALLEELEVFAQKHSGYAGGKAWSIIAGIYSERKDWDAAETAWAAAAKTAKKTYLAPLALFNAGAAAEERGRVAQAIEYYSGSLSAAADFPSAPRAQFAIGRLHESLRETDAAIEAYRAVISGWSYDRVWTNLAQSRIIALETESETETEEGDSETAD